MTNQRRWRASASWRWAPCALLLLGSAFYPLVMVALLAGQDAPRSGMAPLAPTALPGARRATLVELAAPSPSPSLATQEPERGVGAKPPDSDETPRGRGFSPPLARTNDAEPAFPAIDFPAARELELD
ncbi:MAG TPA: hypothetical protein VF989_11630 [Polyangiaceae bacterium]